MTDNIQDLRDNTFKYVRRTIGDQITYDDELARDEIYRMTATQATAVLTMPKTEMITRWAPEIEYEEINDEDQ